MVKIIKEDREGKIASMRNRGNAIAEIKRTTIDELKKAILDYQKFDIKDVEKPIRAFDNFIDDELDNPSSPLSSLVDKYEGNGFTFADIRNLAMDAVREDESLSSLLYDDTVGMIKDALDVYIEDLSDIIAEIINSGDAVTVFGKDGDRVLSSIKNSLGDRLIYNNPELTFHSLEKEEDDLQGIVNATGATASLDEYRAFRDFDFDKDFGTSGALGILAYGHSNPPSSFEDVATGKYKDKLFNRISSKIKK